MYGTYPDCSINISDRSGSYKLEQYQPSVGYRNIYYKGKLHEELENFGQERILVPSLLEVLLYIEVPLLSY